MIRILYLTGTSPFETLEHSAIEIAKLNNNIHISLQTISDQSKLTDKPFENIYIFSWHDTINYSNYDLVVTHCGAGTVFNLLDNEVKFIAVVNNQRTDSHQHDLARYLKKYNYCFVSNFKIPSLEDIFLCLNTTYEPYVKVAFKKRVFIESVHFYSKCDVFAE